MRQSFYSLNPRPLIARIGLFYLPKVRLYRESRSTTVSTIGPHARRCCRNAMLKMTDVFPNDQR
jgi:hypothetical protein